MRDKNYHARHCIMYYQAARTVVLSDMVMQRKGYAMTPGRRMGGRQKGAQMKSKNVKHSRPEGVEPPLCTVMI